MSLKFDMVTIYSIKYNKLVWSNMIQKIDRELA